MATSSKPQEWVIFVQSTKIGTHENKSIRSSRHLLVSLSATLQDVMYKAVKRPNIRPIVLWMGHTDDVKGVLLSSPMR